jgi:tetratricopeptide (TPR) repeat protein
MTRASRFAHIPLCLFATAALSFGGCSVFQPVGEFFAQGYRNTVSYFNAYYNASKLYRTAVEEIEQARRAQRSALTPLPVVGNVAPIPASARQKLNSVIDKCSNILAFHSKSDLVDDALLLIARSYYLQGEYVKSERKCTELLAQYPTSDLRNEARILYGRVLAELTRPDEAQAALTEGLAAAELEGRDGEQAEALEALSTLRRKQGDTAGALRYASRLRAIAPDDESVASAILNEAQLLVEQGRPGDALEPLSSIPRATEEPSLVFDAQMLRLEALRRLGRYEEALTINEEMAQDLRFKDRLGPVALERARLLKDAGRTEEAIEAYTFADTAFARQASAADAAYELGYLFETALNDYAAAAKKFERSGAAGSFTISAEARRRASMFNRYFQLQARLSQNDSLRRAAELLPPDSTGRRTNLETIDSLTTLLAVTMQDLGEWFYSELQRPDSAGWWLKRSADMGRRHRNTPRGWYLLADLALTDTTGILGHRDSLLQRIVLEYPESPYAVESRKKLGMQEYRVEDPSEILYREAELASDAGSYQRAADRLDSIVTAYPSSALVAKSLYAAGWTYDNRLDRADSAVVRYQAVVQRFGATEYAEQARRRLAMLGPAKTDSTTKRAAPPRLDEVRAEPVKPGSVRDSGARRSAVRDSTKNREID